MSDYPIDLTNCERERIHVPGQIQSHGFLLVLDPEGIICSYSENIHHFIPGLEIDLIGRPIGYIERITGTAAGVLGQRVHAETVGKPIAIELAGSAYVLIRSATSVYQLLEFEPGAREQAPAMEDTMGEAILQMLEEKQLDKLLACTAALVKRTIQYDRVMVYRFAADGHGEVVAEARNNDLLPWLGLHYPASDIPKQARELYKLNLTRLINNVHTIPSPLIKDTRDRQPLDLTYVQLRAVSPIHIQYLKNMGVASSFSISIIHNSELWGLIACHNYTPKFIPFPTREAGKLIGKVLSSLLDTRKQEEDHQETEFFKNTLNRLSRYLQKSSRIEHALTRPSLNLLHITRAGGAVLIYDNQIHRLGKTPGDAQIGQLIEWLTANSSESIYHTSSLSAVYPPAAAFRNVASGILFCAQSRKLGQYLIWFKPEILQTIRWAGDPDKPVSVHADGTTSLHPRHSFEIWAQQVAGHSAAWSPEEIKSVQGLKEEISYAINIKASALRLLHEKLRLAYEELDTFSFTIAHDLKNPLTVIKTYAQLLLREPAIGEPARLHALRIEDRAGKMTHLINEVLEHSRIGRLELRYQRVDAGALIQDIMQDLKVVYPVQEITFVIGPTPELQGDPTMLQQLFANLIGNAVKYAQPAERCVVHISGSAATSGVRYTIKDNGRGIAVKDLPGIFQLFKRMDNVQDVEGNGVGLAIVKRIVEKHQGRIWVESELGNGSTFFIHFDPN